MKEERREIAETMRKAMPKEVGGILRRIVGAKEADERRKRVKFREERRRLVKEQAFLLSLDDEEGEEKAIVDDFDVNFEAGRGGRIRIYKEVKMLPLGMM